MTKFKKDAREQVDAGGAPKPLRAFVYPWVRALAPTSAFPNSTGRKEMVETAKNERRRFGKSAIIISPIGEKGYVS